MQAPHTGLAGDSAVCLLSVVFTSCPPTSIRGQRAESPAPKNNSKFSTVIRMFWLTELSDLSFRTFCLGLNGGQDLFSDGSQLVS